VPAPAKRRAVRPKHIHQVEDGCGSAFESVDQLLDVTVHASTLRVLPTRSRLRHWATRRRTPSRLRVEVREKGDVHSAIVSSLRHRMREEEVDQCPSPRVDEVFPSGTGTPPGQG